MCSKFETSLLSTSSLVLDGLKPAALIMCTKEELRSFIKEIALQLERKGIKYRILGKIKKMYRLYVYNERNLKKQLFRNKEQKVLSYYGYKNMNLNEMFFNLKNNLINSNGEFPHEIGIFLGYPVEDVLAFVKNQGKNYKLCGCWKVYTNTKLAEECFRKYEMCKNKYLQRVYNNENFVDIIGA